MNGAAVVAAVAAAAAAATVLAAARRAAHRRDERADRLAWAIDDMARASAVVIRVLNDDDSGRETDRAIEDYAAGKRAALAKVIAGGSLSTGLDALRSGGSR